MNQGKACFAGNDMVIAKMLNAALAYETPSLRANLDEALPSLHSLKLNTSVSRSRALAKSSFRFAETQTRLKMEQ
jgi:hypothetical protein